MFNTASLSLEQAPPISIPLRFFLTAPLFGVFAGVLMLIYGPEIVVSRWLPETLALTHTITLGFLAMVMCGALMQMLPVLAGAPIPKVQYVGGYLHVGLGIGTLALVFAFLNGSSSMATVAIGVLGSSIGIFIAAFIVAIFRVRVSNATITGMRLAVSSLLITVVLGLLLLAAQMGWINAESSLRWIDVHVGWGLLGWVGLLLISVSYQVVPMFHVTPDYPEWMCQKLVVALFVLLLIWGAVGIFTLFELKGLLLLPVVLGVLAFAAITYRLLQQKRRKVRDVTLYFWRSSLVAVLIAGILWVIGSFFIRESLFSELHLLIGGLTLFAAMSVVQGMLYKIAPFLSWFHLQHRQMSLMQFTISVPHMKAFLPDKWIGIQFYLWLGASAFTLSALFIHDALIYPGATLFVTSNILLFYNLFSVTRLYQQVNRQLLAGGSPVVPD